MNKHITLALFLIFLHFESKAQKNFEGFIKLKIEITTEGNDLEYKKQLDDKYGDSLKVLYSRKGFKREYLNSINTGNLNQIYNSENGILYLKKRKTLKIDSLDVKINSLNLISKTKIRNETILNLDCECYEYKAVTIKNDSVVLNYCFNKKIKKIDSKFFQKHNDFFFNEYFKIAERPYLKFLIRTAEFQISQVATEIIEQKLDDDLFQIK